MFLIFLVLACANWQYLVKSVNQFLTDLVSSKTILRFWWHGFGDMVPLSRVGQSVCLEIIFNNLISIN